MRRRALAWIAVGGLACSAIRPGDGAAPGAVAGPHAPELPLDPWPITRLVARLAADSLRFADADAVLARYAAAHPGTPEQREAEFMRVLLLLDPANPAGSPNAAVRALDAYLSAAGETTRAPEARALRRALVLADSLATSAAQARTAAQARDRAKDEELQRLRDELAQTHAELERIRRRLTRRP